MVLFCNYFLDLVYILYYLFIVIQISLFSAFNLYHQTTKLLNFNFWFSTTIMFVLILMRKIDQQILHIYKGANTEPRLRGHVPQLNLSFYSLIIIMFPNSKINHNGKNHCAPD